MTTEASSSESGQPFQLDWALIASIGACVLFVGAVGFSIKVESMLPYLDRAQQDAFSGAAFALAITIPVIASWRRAIRDSHLPSRWRAEPRYEHVSGWGAIFFACVVAAIAGLVWWAAQSDDADRHIHSQWGMWVVVGLSAAFVTVAGAPLAVRLIRQLGLERPLTEIARYINMPASWIGNTLSVVDAFLVFAVANSAGTNRRHLLLRYGILLTTLTSCAALGYFWNPPVAFIPLAWAFIIAFSVSRRWAWIEQDRELAMLNARISAAHIRVGFDQNLRDEALVSFLSMFLLVPLALRQAQSLADANGIILFTMSPGVSIDSILVWIGFYGTELAKAVPFVDWAEIYQVEGDASVRALSDASRHTVFGTRVLVDLVFLAALLQAISSASRDAQQRELFYVKQSIHRLDPFSEPDAFRSLVRRGASGQWERNADKFDNFPSKYDQDRLVELSAHSDERIRRAADFLLERDGVQSDPHHRLSAIAAQRDTTPEEIKQVLNEIENAGGYKNPYQLSLARRRLIGRKDMADGRLRILAMLDQAQPSIERTNALIDALVGESREGYQRARKVALEALAKNVAGNLRVRAAIRQAADHDAASAIKRRAREVLVENPERPD